MPEGAAPGTRPDDDNVVVLVICHVGFLLYEADDRVSRRGRWVAPAFPPGGPAPESPRVNDRPDAVRLVRFRTRSVLDRAERLSRRGSVTARKSAWQRWSRPNRGSGSRRQAGSADVFVVFGITGDLAKVMTFRSLYRLERRGLLDCPIVGVAVDDWTVDQLVQRARESIEGTGEPIDPAVFDRFAERLSYVQGDFGDAATYARVGDAIKGADCPVFYLEIPPFLFGRVVKGLADAGPDDDRPAWWWRNRSATTRRPPASWRTSCTSTSTSPSCTGSTTTSERWGWRRSSTCGSPTRCSSRSGTGTTSTASRSPWRRISASRTVVTSTIRSVLCATWWSITSCRSCPPPRWSHRPAVTRKRSRTHRSPCSGRSSAADPTHYVRGQYEGYRDINGVAADSATETYAALRLDIDNWRWSGVPFFIRTGKRLPVTQTELRLVFKDPPRLGFGFRTDRRPEPNQLVVKLDPSTGIRLKVDARRADAARPRGDQPGHGVRRRRAARGRRPTRCCCTPRWSGRAPGSPARTGSRRRGGSCSRCWTRRRRCTATRPGHGVRQPPMSWSPPTAAGTDHG